MAALLRMMLLVVVLSLLFSVSTVTALRIKIWEPFVVAGAGKGYSQPPEGYRMSTLAEIKSSKFVKFYNSGGLQRYNNETFTGCCQFMLQEGYLGLQGAIPFGPYNSQGMSECANPEQLTGTVYFGTTEPWPGVFIGKLNATTVAQLVAMSNVTDQHCLVYSSWWGIYTLVRQMNPPFIVAGAGQGYPSPPTGYRLTSLSEIKSSKFVSYYNGGGLQVFQSETFNGCCQFLLKEGYLGLPSDIPFGPYTSGGQSECANPEIITGSVFFGTVEPWPGSYIGKLNASTVSQLVAMSNATDPQCNPYVSWWAIYSLEHDENPPFIVAGAGQGYPNPPTGYRFASLADIKSSKFVSFYNGGGLGLFMNETFSGCCQFMLKEGYLGLPNDIPFGPYTSEGMSECANPEIITGSIFFGTLEPWPGSYIGPLNASTVSQLVAMSDATDPQCDSYSSWWGIYTRTDAKRKK